MLTSPPRPRTSPDAISPYQCSPRFCLSAYCGICGDRPVGGPVGALGQRGFPIRWAPTLFQANANLVLGDVVATNHGKLVHFGSIPKLLMVLTA